MVPFGGERPRTNYRPLVFGGRTPAAGAHITTAGGAAARPPNWAFLACPRHSSEEEQPVMKSSEQPQTNNKIRFIFNILVKINVFMAAK
jgi:hypothetical protein